ncbi:unnamed protein product [Brugia pahangi]|uniref:Transcription initiation factor TFIID subunit 10 n=1 Tax=Brugia pahangi TaxID=6280 RepID=A0A0N4TE52_BRUPA|nr:unnamed protein product [Brugia pahangi]
MEDNMLTEEHLDRKCSGQVILLLATRLVMKMENPFLYSVKLILGERYTDNMDAIYKTVIQLILQRMEEACRTEVMKIRNKNVEI